MSSADAFDDSFGSGDAAAGDRPGGPPPPPLRVNACRSLCSWGPTPRSRGGLPLFRCSGCGSEWVRTEPWTPVDADGETAAEVAAEAARRD